MHRPLPVRGTRQGQEALRFRSPHADTVRLRANELLDGIIYCFLSTRVGFTRWFSRRKRKGVSIARLA